MKDKYLIPPRGTKDKTTFYVKIQKKIINIIENIVDTYGYNQISTPSIEHINNLLKKYGAINEKLIFTIFNINYLKNSIKNNNYKKIDLLSLCKMGLIYDLTIPLIRFIKNNSSIKYPFKRYQIQKVWRADKPQYMRYREFYQCDIDIISKSHISQEIEILELCNNIFNSLNIPVIIKINDKSILIDIINDIGLNKIERKIFLSILDKSIDRNIYDIYDKIKLTNINKNSIKRFFKLYEYIMNSDDINIIIYKLDTLKYKTKKIKKIFNFFSVNKMKKNLLKFDLRLTRGIEYYDDIIFEIFVNNNIDINNRNISIAGGGRYTKLLDMYNINNMSGIGISLGIDRIIDIVYKLHMYNNYMYNFKKTEVLFINFGYNNLVNIFKYLKILRKNGILCELYPYNNKIYKQLKYANNNDIKYILIIGNEEIKQKKIIIRNMINKKEYIENNIFKIINIINNNM